MGSPQKPLSIEDSRQSLQHSLSVKWLHAHGILSSELTAHAWYTVCCTNSPLTALQKQKQALKTHGCFVKQLLCFTYCLAWVFFFRAADSTHHFLAHRSWSTAREIEKENKGTHRPIISGAARFPKSNLCAMTNTLGPTAFLGILYVSFCQCFLYPVPLANGLC